MDEAGVAAKCGVPPARYADMAILRGDPSDGLPGVAGVGEKTAARLLNEYGDLDALLAGAAGGRLPARLAAALGSSVDYLAAMRRVVPVATDVDARQSAGGPPDRDRLEELGRRHGLDAPVRRLLAALGQA
jgi:5'-3' exonuclease